MKRLLRFIGITLLVLIIALVTLPFVFQNQITDLVKAEGNKMIKGEFDFDELKISFFKDFPQVSIAMHDFWLHGEGEFAKDTLAQMGELSLTVDLSSFFSKQYQVNTIALRDAKFRAIIDKAGVPNWDIMASDSTETETTKDTTETDSKPATFNIALQRVIVDNLAVAYQDKQAGTAQAYEDINMDLAVTLQNDRYALHNSRFAMGDLAATVDGWVAIISETEMDFDVTLDTEKAIITLEDMPKVQVSPTTLKATPALITLQPTRIKIADSDMTVDCTIRDLMEYLNKKGIVSGEMNLNSTRLNLNAFMSDTEAETTEKESSKETSTEDMQVIEVPERINFKVNANCQTIQFQDIVMEALKGQLVAKDQMLAMKGLTFNTMMGTAGMNGVYSTKNKKAPKVVANLSLKDISFEEAHKQSNVIKKLAPIFENTKGTFSSDMHMNMNFDNHMQPVMKSVNGKGFIAAKDLEVAEIEVLTKIAEATKKPELAKLSAKDLQVDFTVKDGVVTTKPFDIKHAGYTMTMSGTTTLEQEVDYNAVIKLPEGKKIVGMNEVGLKIGGTFDKPSVKIDTKKVVNQLFDNLLKKKSSDKDDKEKSDLEKGVDLLKGLF